MSTNSSYNFLQLENRITLNKTFSHPALRPGDNPIITNVFEVPPSYIMVAEFVLVNARATGSGGALFSVKRPDNSTLPLQTGSKYFLTEGDTIVGTSTPPNQGTSSASFTIVINYHLTPATFSAKGQTQLQLQRKNEKKIMKSSNEKK